MNLFDRTASVTFGPNGTEDGIKVDGLRIRFTVTKDLKPETNSGRVSIYNLSEATHGKIKAGDTLILRAGYRQGDSTPPILALGSIREVVRSMEDADRVSTITLEDGLAQLRQARISVSYPDNTAAATVLQDAIDALGLPAYELPAVDQSIKYVSGLAFEGTARALMSKVCSKLGLEWSVQTGKVLVVPKGGTGQIKAVLLKALSGLLGTPERLTEDKDELQQDEEKRPNGWRFRSLLRSEFIPGGTVRIESIAVTGNFRIESVTHAGDTHGDEWSSLIEVREPKEAA